MTTLTRSESNEQGLLDFSGTSTKSKRKRSVKPRSTKAPAHAAEPMTPDALYAKWEPLAFKLTAGWTIPGYEHEDLQQEARIAIYNTAKAFNPEKGCFFTVAKHSIHNRLSSLLTKTRAKKRMSFVQSLDEPSFDDGLDFHEILAGVDYDASMPRGVGVAETIREHLVKTLRSTPKSRRKIFLARVEESLRSAEETYGFEVGELTSLGAAAKLAC